MCTGYRIRDVQPDGSFSRDCDVHRACQCVVPLYKPRVRGKAVAASGRVASVAKGALNSDGDINSGFGLFYAVVGGPWPGIHLTPDYEASASSVVAAFPDARVGGPSDGVHDMASAARILSLWGYGAVIPCDVNDVVVWTLSATGYVGRLGNAQGRVVISPQWQDGALTGISYAPSSSPTSPPENRPGCARSNCPCTSTYDNNAGSYCGRTCRDGKPCAANYHPTPSGAAGRP